ncbi:TonB-dependent receptor [Granulicella sp. S156]|uniref:TonB-dependent receptor n=1 Tax=Granulicella sp. S156 TaxID=1747224 RepID=UPI00131EB5EB|nr:carboxypeptidase regulatory-like domain-containing protein [Granulicella sp. S156]
MMSLRKALILGFVCSLLALPGVAQTPQTPSSGPAATVPASAPQAVAPQVATSQSGAKSATKVHGTVTDPDGELIPGATITLTPAHGNATTATSGSDGSYSVNIAPGSYTLLVAMKGFASYSMLNLKIPAVASTTVDAKLKIGEETEVINVDANAIQLSVDPDSNQSATILTGKDLDALSDDPDELSSELTALAGPSAGPNGGQIYVDGFTGGQLPPKSSIREIRINQNPFSAQYDKLGYGRIEIFTKPGTDKIHGNIQVNGNPSQFNSSDPLATGYQPPYHTLFLFGNLTGPLNKSASYNLGGSYRQIQDDQFTNTNILATAAAPTVLCAPGSTTCVLTPYQVSTYYPQTRADFNPRVDLALGDKNVLTTRYQYVKNDSTNAGIGNLTLPTAAYNGSTTSNILQMSDTETFSPKLINETRFEYEREHVQDTALNNTPTVSVSGSFTAGGYGSQNLSDHQDHYEVQNYTSLQLKKNFIRFGGRLRATREAEDTGSNTNGLFIYSGLCNTVDGSTASNAPCTGVATADDHTYQTGTPSQFTITQVNNHKIGDTDTDLGVYLETDWKARQNLTVSYGFRYETQNHLADHHDIAPRASFNYGLFGGKGAPKTVLRGGFGLFYDRFQQSNVLTLEAENGINTTVYTVPNPVATCLPSASNLIAACVPSGTGASAQTTYSATSNLRSPYIVQFAGGADQQVGRYGTISVNYLHSQGVHQLATQNINYDFDAATPHATGAPNNQYFSEGVFNQNQLIINGRVQTSKRISLFGYYSLNSAHGDTSGAGAEITTPGNIANDYGRTTFDVKNRLFLAGSITLPKFIQFSPFMIAQSGNPYNVTTGTDNNGDSYFNDRPDIVTGVATNGNTIKTIAGCGTFAQPGIVAGASVAPINACTGPTLFTFNFRLTKTIGFGPSTAPKPTGGSGSHSGSGSRSGGGGNGGGGGRGGPGGGGPGFGGGGSNTGRRYNLAFGLQVQNLFNNEDLATPQGVLSSKDFGQSTQITGSPYTTTSALRRISLQTSFSF